MKQTIAFATLFAAALAGAADTVVVTPTATKEALVNPGMGFMFYRNAGRLWAYVLGGTDGEPGWQNASFALEKLK